LHMIVPYALQIRWARARPRSGDHQVAAKLIV
jgi:hypothetical protein